jgi:hypothetical protein
MNIEETLNDVRGNKDILGVKGSGKHWVAY